MFLILFMQLNTQTFSLKALPPPDSAAPESDIEVNTRWSCLFLSQPLMAACQAYQLYHALMPSQKERKKVLREIMCK